ncbi:MAG: hypothetical protein WCJ66_00505 [Verrucomicrobiota bacterium]
MNAFAHLSCGLEPDDTNWKQPDKPLENDLLSTTGRVSVTPPEMPINGLGSVLCVEFE